MIRKYILPLFVFAIFLTACATSTPTETVVTENPPVKTPKAVEPTPYPAPLVVTQPPTQPAYPGPGDPGTGTPNIPLSGYEPQLGDDTLRRSEVILDIGPTRVIVVATDPGQLKVELSGNLPDPCHRLRAVVSPADDQNVINVEVYALVDPGVACITKIEPFTATIPLGSYSDGRYTVMINDQRMGEFDVNFEPQTADEKLTRGEVFMQIDNSAVMYDSDPAFKVAATLIGELPTPCHQLRIVENPADSQKRIKLELYSVYDPQTTCIAVTQPFYVIYPFTDLPAGHYSIYVNDELLGEFDI